MNKALWVTLGIGLAGMVALAWMFQWSATSLGGVEETRELEATLGAAYGPLFEGSPPLRVARMPGRADGDHWRWLVEGTVREGTPPRDLERALERIVVRSLAAGVGSLQPSGVRIRLRRPGGAVLVREFDGSGRALGGGGGGPDGEGGAPPGRGR